MIEDDPVPPPKGGAENLGCLEKSTAEALLHTLDEHVIVAITDPRGVITHANSQFCQISQYSQEELVGSTHKMINSGYHPASFWKEAWDTIKGGKSWKGQVCNRAKDGSLYWVQTTIHPILGADGEIAQYVAFRTDISAQKQVENKLRNSQMHLQETARVAKVGSWEVDLLAEKVTWSWTTKMIHEVPPEFEPTLEAGIEFYPEGPHRERIKFLVERAISTGEPFDEELQIQLANSRRKWVRAIGQAERVDSQCVRIYGVFQDIDNERKLHEENERTALLLRNLVDSATEFGLIATDKEGIITLFNAGAEKLLGYKAEELVGKATPAVIHLASEAAERAGELTEQYGELVAGFETFVKVSLDVGSEQREWTYVRKDGSQVPVALVVTPMRDKNGDLTGFLGISRDLSAQRKAENELSDSEERFRRSFEYSGIGMAIVSMEGQWIQVNQSLLEMLGYEREAMLKLTFQDITHPDDLELDLELLRETIAGKRQNYSMEKRYFDASGGTIWVKLNVSLVRDVKGEPVHFVAQIENISDSKNLARQMKQVSDRLALATRAGGVGIWDFDIQTGTLIWDEQMLKLYGISHEDFAGDISNWKKGIHPDDFEAAVKSVEAAVSGEAEFNTQFRVVWPDGTVRHLSALALVQRDEDGNARRMVGTNWDVSDFVEQKREFQRLAEQAEEASKAKSQFLANMSHEIRTPINGVIGMTSLLIDSPGLTSEQVKQAEVIQSSGEALLALINDILDFSKIEAGKLDLEILDFDLRDTLDDLNALLALRAREKKLEFSCRADSQVPDRLTGDPGRLRQILLNLAGNAIKFTSSGKVDVFVAELSRSASEVELRFSVKDTGIGIAAAKQRSLFSEFTQADSSTTRLYGGTGLGLAICKQLVDLMEGDIGVESVEGDGAEFWVTIRFPYEGGEYDRGCRPDFSGKSALLVMGAESQRRDLAERLKKWNVKLFERSSAGQALDLLRKKAVASDSIDYLFFDPKGSDLSSEAMQSGCKQIEGGGDMRFILVSDPDYQTEAEDSAHLCRPLRRSDLYHVMVGSIEGAQRRRETTFAEAASGRFAERNVRILVAEDNVVNQMVVRGILGKFGLHADTVANGLEALEALQRIPYDLVLMDVQMPELDGLGASQRIRAGDAGEHAKSVPIIALTAHARAEDKQECLDAGMNEYVSKPVVPKVLFKVLSHFLSNEGAVEKAEAKAGDFEQVQVFDRESLISGMMGDEGLAREIAELSVLDLKKYQNLLQHSFDARNLDEALRSIHSIKGVSGHAACLKLNEFSRRVETESRKGNKAMMSESRAELSRLIDESVLALGAFLKR